MKGFDYVGPLAAHLTFVTRLRQQFFLRTDVCDLCLEALREASSKHNALVHAYCLMPDHAHVLVEMGVGEVLTEFARLFKQLSGYRMKKLTGQELWQTSYHDRVLRNEESLVDVAAYIWANPVRAELVENDADYEWSGPPELLSRL